MNDKIYTSVPVNKQAALVTQQTDSEYTPKGDTRTIRSKTPLPTESIKIGRNEYGIIGKKFGSLTIVGAYPFGNRNKNRKWVVKCDCGYYETRYLNSLKTAQNEYLCCIDCQKIKRMSKENTDKDYSITGMLLKELCEDGFFRTRNVSFSKKFKLNEVVINQNNEKDIITYVSNRKISFALGLFKEGDKIKKI